MIHFQTFQTDRGFRQDDPLSPTLFILYIEYLAYTLCDRPPFNGLKIGGLSVKVSMFADDTLVFLNGLKNQFKADLNIFQAFGKISGCRVNLDNFETFRI